MSPKVTTIPKKNNSSGESAGSLHIVREFADTTWRIATPVILFVAAGIVLDKRLGSQPWLTLLGMVVGFIFAALLVKRQIDSGDDNTKDVNS